MKKILFSLLILLTGCASLPLVDSQDLSDPDSSPRYMYDVENNIAYRVAHDEDNLYLELRTDDETAIQKIVRNGLFVYIDPQGGKSKDIYFNYPLQMKLGKGGIRKMMQQNEGKFRPGEKREFNVNQMLENLSTEAIYSNNKTTEMIPVFARSKSYKVELSAPTNEQLVYKLKIPLAEVLDVIKEEHVLSLGIMTGKFEMPSRQGGQGAAMSGGMGGGRSEGGIQGGGRPGGMNMVSVEDIQKMQEQISIWFSFAL